MDILDTHSINSDTKIHNKKNIIDKILFVQQNARMEQHVLEFLYNAINRYKISVNCDDVSAEYSIELDSGSVLFFECRYACDTRNRPARYYAVSLDDQIISESYCLNSCKKPTPQTRQLMRLIEKCSNKVLSQEIQARKSGLLSQIIPSKVHS